MDGYDPNDYTEDIFIQRETLADRWPELSPWERCLMFVLGQHPVTKYPKEIITWIKEVVERYLYIAATVIPTIVFTPKVCKEYALFKRQVLAWTKGSVDPEEDEVERFRISERVPGLLVALDDAFVALHQLRMEKKADLKLALKVDKGGKWFDPKQACGEENSAPPSHPSASGNLEMISSSPPNPPPPPPPTPTGETKHIAEVKLAGWKKAVVELGESIDAKEKDKLVVKMPDNEAMLQSLDLEYNVPEMEDFTGKIPPDLCHAVAAELNVDLRPAICDDPDMFFEGLYDD
ncbi:hypothetical protein K470DRAFT_268965 [Piedraia hortae CBS 480.64]|uniref:Uncharacterized protein n=1 Tax=Piedraia hortae CBS 480.64 TaxID=1314780 RepID=A0A6A7C4X0_9PEZI|nr:hypothetical protein K470DRAFT_268965 [Piedraia hortae CBS 480.64]